MKEIKVIMQSKPFGREEYGPYDSWDEAYAAMTRLREQCEKADDFIERLIGFVVNEGQEDDECTW